MVSAASQALDPAGSVSQIHRERNQRPKWKFVLLFITRYFWDGSIPHRWVQRTGVAHGQHMMCKVIKETSRDPFFGELRLENQFVLEIFFSHVPPPLSRVTWTDKADLPPHLPGTKNHEAAAMTQSWKHQPWEEGSLEELPPARPHSWNAPVEGSLWLDYLAPRPWLTEPGCKLKCS